jgi:MraZ protein
MGEWRYIEKVSADSDDEVFEYLANFDNLPEYEPWVQTVERSSDGPIRVGSTWTDVRRMGRRRISAPIELVEYEQNRRLALVSGSGGVNVRATQTFEPTEEGTQVVELLEMTIRGPRGFASWILPLAFRPGAPYDGQQWEKVGESGDEWRTSPSQLEHTGRSQVAVGASGKEQQMFLGQYERSLDEKSRVPIPPELRTGLGNGAVLTRSFDNCLCIYPAARWEALARAVDDLPHVRREVRLLARSLFGGAVPCEFDRQGRIVIPVFLREHAGLCGDVVIVGVFSSVEIWSREAWTGERQKIESEGSQLAEVLSTSRA